ncbi:hypothetical protein KNE206_08130 [Kitasatospora sp. NE20-6]|uniref:ParB/RepB/Spo0J family partition protein n=1 Tax=Kitasatospora sp. NE20-6 TaxID=2859066 RepID=UPI0034DCB1FB
MKVVEAGHQPDTAHALRLGPACRAPVAALRPADSPRTTGEDPEHVRLLADSEDDLPPIIVHRGTMRVVDGMHRLKAAVLRGDREITVRFFEGSPDEAFVLAVRSNTGHGLPLSAADRRAAAVRILESHPQWSDRAVATAAGLAARTVAALRSRIPAPAPAPAPHGGTDAGGPWQHRVGRDGRARPLDSSEGRRLAGRLITDAPDASLRTIAQQSGISPGTVRDVRDRLRRGEDPVPLRVLPVAPPPERGRDDAHTVVRLAPPGERRTALADSLHRDPSLRLSETGRLLLRMLQVRTLPPAQWERIISTVPAHSTGMLSAAAAECAEAWQQFAARMERRRCAGE